MAISLQQLSYTQVAESTQNNNITYTKSRTQFQDQQHHRGNVGSRHQEDKRAEKKFSPEIRTQSTTTQQEDQMKH